jgi:uncharacterized protein (DUF1501 family)
MKIQQNILQRMTRREVLTTASQGLGVAAVGSLLTPARLLGATGTLDPKALGGLPGLPHFAPRAKRVIFLFQAGAPSQLELFEYKPRLKELHGTQLPASISKGDPGAEKRSDLKVAAPMFEFRQAGQSGTWISELLPHTAKIVDDIAIIHSVQTEVPNHEPAINFFQTGSIVPGRPSMGAWVTYGLGSENQDVPAFVVLLCKTVLFNSSVTARYWSNGFMPSKYQGVAFRAAKDPVSYLSNPPGVDATAQQEVLQDLEQLNQLSYQKYRDPEIQSRTAQYRMAYRMQASLPELTDLSKEPESVFESYGPDSRTAGTYAANCLLARRLAERDVRFIQLYQRGWDQHGNLPKEMRIQCQLVDQASAALVRDLKQRGLLEDTLVIWAGEFGRTVYCQNILTADNYGRDHHGQCFTVWMAGGGIKPGISFGETDDFSYNVVRDPVTVHDLQATILHCLGIDHTRLIYKFQGRYFRLTDIAGEVVKGILI